MDAKTSVLLFGAIFGLVMGYFTARSSQRRDPIYGGGASQFFHYIMSSTVTALPVTIIAYAIASKNLLQTIGVAFGFFIVLWGSALIFASIERPPRETALAQQESRGWTEEDARTSGL